MGKLINSHSLILHAIAVHPLCQSFGRVCRNSQDGTKIGPVLLIKAGIQVELRAIEVAAAW